MLPHSPPQHAQRGQGPTYQRPACALAAASASASCWRSACCACCARSIDASEAAGVAAGWPGRERGVARPPDSCAAQQRRHKQQCWKMPQSLQSVLQEDGGCQPHIPGDGAPKNDAQIRSAGSRRRLHGKAQRLPIRQDPILYTDQAHDTARHTSASVSAVSLKPCWPKNSRTAASSWRRSADVSLSAPGPAPPAAAGAAAAGCKPPSPCCWPGAPELSSVASSRASPGTTAASSCAALPTGGPACTGRREAEGAAEPGAKMVCRATLRVAPSAAQARQHV